MADRSSNKIFKYPGGFIKSDIFHYGEDDPDDHIFAIAWGEVIHDPKIRIFKTGKKKTEFAIRYMRGGYVVVNIWGDTPAADAAASLRATDMVCCKGIITRHQYINSRDEVKETRFMSAFSVEPYDFTLFLQKLFHSPTINKILDEEEGDVMESAGDYGINEDSNEDSSDEVDGLFM